MLYGVWYLPMLALAVLGAWSGLRDVQSRSAVVLIVASLLVVSATQALFYVEGRHRLAIEPLLLILSGGGLALLARTLWRGRVDHRAVLRESKPSLR
jgi:hypothetical protein